jgi:glycosyltransferase involved in cell wall biosynthesis
MSLHVLNVTFMLGKAGTEQAFMDYTDALLKANNKVTTLVPPEFYFLNALKSRKANLITTNYTGKRGPYDLIAIWQLRRLIRNINPDIVIVHDYGTRAISIIKKAVKGIYPVIAVNHGEALKACIGSEAVITLSKSMFAKTVSSGQPADKTFLLSNAVKIHEENIEPSWHNPPVIGVLSRIESNKGSDIFIDALNILKNKKINFKVIIGGEGSYLPLIEKKIDEYQLKDQVKIVGWITDKVTFFNNIDIFCLPSRFEPFGIVLLEAMANKKPIITTDTEGPSDIFSNYEDGIIVPKEDSTALAIALEELLTNKEKAMKIAELAHLKVKNNYSDATLANELDRIIHKVSETNKILI